MSGEILTDDRGSVGRVSGPDGGRWIGGTPPRQNEEQAANQGVAEEVVATLCLGRRLHNAFRALRGELQ